MAQSAKQVFTPEQAAWLEKRLNAVQGFDRATIKWLIGGLIVLGLAVSGLVWSELGSVRDQVSDNRAVLARIEATQAAHGERLGKIEDTLAIHGERLAGIESALERIETLLAE